MNEIKMLDITSVTAGYSGTNKNGNDFTIYDIEANGVSVALRSFDKLPIGRNEYEVETYTNNGKTSYTLKPHGFKVGRTPASVSRQEFEALDLRVMNLEKANRGSDIPTDTGEWPEPTAVRDDDSDDIPF